MKFDLRAPLNNKMSFCILSPLSLSPPVILFLISFPLAVKFQSQPFELCWRPTITELALFNLSFTRNLVWADEQINEETSTSFSSEFCLLLFISNLFLITCPDVSSHFTCTVVLDVAAVRGAGDIWDWIPVFPAVGSNGSDLMWQTDSELWRSWEMDLFLHCFAKLACNLALNPSSLKVTAVVFSLMHVCWPWFGEWEFKWA